VVAQEPDHLILIHELTILEALLGTEFLQNGKCMRSVPKERKGRKERIERKERREKIGSAHLPLLLLWIVCFVRILGSTLSCLRQRASTMSEELDVECLRGVQLSD
jgi:hypothetical protein